MGAGGTSGKSTSRRTWKREITVGEPLRAHEWILEEGRGQAPPGDRAGRKKNADARGQGGGGV